MRRILAIVLLATWTAFLFVRNDAWEFCTTRAYGHPLPVYIDWCPCVKNTPSLQLLHLAVDLLLLAGVWWLACRLFRKRNVPEHE